MNFTRKTLKQPAIFEGLGLHSGVPVTMTVHPGESGIQFRCDGVTTKAHPENVTETVRCTKLGNVQTVEHIMSAFAGLQITDAEVELTAGEIPGADGSAMPFIVGLTAAGFEGLDEVTLPELFTRVFLQEDDVKIAIGKGTGHWRFEYETGDRWPGSMTFESMDAPNAYIADIASARTFALSEELPKIIELGLGRGLDESSALVLGIEGFKNEARFPDEPARHKLLDLIGDLYLAGVPMQFLNVVGHRSGHRTNVKAAKQLAASLGILP